MVETAQLSEGSGPLFTDVDADRARRVFQKKPKQLVDKTMSVSEAVEKYVADGDYLASGGFGGNRIANAILHEIVRQKKQNLEIAGHTTTHDFQVLCAGNMTGRGQLVKKIDAAYIVGLEARGLSPHARRVIQSGEVEVCEWTNFALATRFQAAAMGVPFLPIRSLAGTDTFARSAAKQIRCPFTGQLLSAIPALWPDIAIIHVHEADQYGNCRIRGTSVADFDVARSAKKLIVSCERLISNDEIREDPTATLIPYYCVDAVCEVPYGCYPANMAGEYFSDEDHLREWLRVEVDPDEHLAFLEKYIFAVNSFEEYLELCGGKKRMEELRKEELYPEP